MVHCYDDELWAHIPLPEVDSPKRESMVRRGPRRAKATMKRATAKPCACCGIRLAVIAGTLCGARACREFVSWE